MSPKEVEKAIKESRSNLEIQVLTMDYLEKKDNRKLIIDKALKKLKKNLLGSKSYEYELENPKKINTFKTTIKEHFRFILEDCNKPLETNFNDYKGEITMPEAYCDFYNEAIEVVKKELKNKKLIKDNLTHYFKKIKIYLSCSDYV
ncbi:MAG TPA: hypothetical protein ENK66_07360 [Arcobacter sp.]|nr:hypothetical protein [Arcobacter sp.]